MGTVFIDKPPTEGEEYLINFFELVGIEYECEKKIEGLSNDSKQFRFADFYLPKYKVYVEFFGRWNNAGNDDYKEKKEVYWRNKIPCVYIYPENLGIIGYTFDKRIQLVFEKYNLKDELIKYRRYKLFKSRELKNRSGILTICLICFGIAFFSVGIKDLDWSIIILVALIGIYQIGCLYDLYIDIFKRNKFSLEELNGRY